MVDTETLSDKIIIETVWEDNGKKRRDLLTTDDVKEFIRELKIFIDSVGFNCVNEKMKINKVFKEIDKLAGDKLI